MCVSLLSLAQEAKLKQTLTYVMKQVEVEQKAGDSWRRCFCCCPEQAHAPPHPTRTQVRRPCANAVTCFLSRTKASTRRSSTACSSGLVQPSLEPVAVVA